ncbi:hypothetical protein E2320_023026 [Naja naja]|nr:hypothetical protein E2320_023026 [Naja naja]
MRRGGWREHLRERGWGGKERDCGRGVGETAGSAAAGRRRLGVSGDCVGAGRAGRGRPDGAAAETPCRAVLQGPRGTGRRPGEAAAPGRRGEGRGGRRGSPRGAAPTHRRAPLFPAAGGAADRPPGGASAERQGREQRARLGCLARDLAALTRQHQEAECRAWTDGRENEELRAELGRAREQLREAQAGRLALEAHWLREKALEATRVNRAMEQEKYWRKVSRLQEKLAKARGQAGQPDVQSDGREGSSLSTSSQEEEAMVVGRGAELGSLCGFGAHLPEGGRWLEGEASQLRSSPAPIRITFLEEAGLFPCLEEGQLLGTT